MDARLSMLTDTLQDRRHVSPLNKIQHSTSAFDFTRNESQPQANFFPAEEHRRTEPQNLAVARSRGLFPAVGVLPPKVRAGGHTHTHTVLLRVQDTSSNSLLAPEAFGTCWVPTFQLLTPGSSLLIPGRPPNPVNTCPYHHSTGRIAVLS